MGPSEARDMQTLTQRTAHLIERIRGVNPYAVDTLLALGFTGGASMDGCEATSLEVAD